MHELRSTDISGSTPNLGPLWRRPSESPSLRQVKVATGLKLMAMAIFVSSLLLPASATQETSKAEESSPEALKGVVVSYFERLDAIYRAGSPPESVDRLLQLMDESVKYEHPRYGANFDLESWRAAFSRNHQRGGYNHGAASETRILKTIVGRDAVVVEHEYLRFTEGEKEPDVRGPYMTLFELKEGRIATVREYW